MNFSDAIEKLKSGKKITRTPWRGEIWFEITDGELLSCQEHFEQYQYDESIMISNDWKLLGDKSDEEYSFCDLMGHLLNGRKAKEEYWQDMYIYYCPKDKQLIVSMTVYNSYTPIIDDFLAQDWIIKEDI